MLPAREFLGLKHVVTMKHLENMNKVMLVTGLMVSYGYIMEHFIAWYSGNEYEFSQFFRTARAGPMAPIYWLMIFCNVVVPQLFWSGKRAHEHPAHVGARRSSSTSGCGASGSTSSSPRSTATSCRRSWENYSPTWVDITPVHRHASACSRRCSCCS